MRKRWYLKNALTTICKNYHSIFVLYRAAHVIATYTMLIKLFIFHELFFQQLQNRCILQALLKQEPLK